MNESPSYRFFPPQKTGPSSVTYRGQKRFATFVILIVFIGSAIFCGGAWFLYRIYQSLPTLEQLQNIEPPLASRVLSREKKPIHEFSIERRFWIPLDKIPPMLSNAVVAIEDRKFYRHWGIDLQRIMGALIVNVVRRDIAQGGSTLTQQLARNVYLTSKQSIIRKIREALTAIQIERFYTKTQILEFYLNQVYLGAGVYGVQAASLMYFGKPASKLSLNECATLAGIVQLPEYYRPDKPANLKRITARRNMVLNAMYDMKFIDKQTLLTETQAPVPVDMTKQTSKTGPYFIEMVRQYIEQKYGETQLYNGGLSVYTTLDPVAQDTADAAAHDQLLILQENLHRLFLNHALRYCKTRVRYDTFMAHFDSLYEVYKDNFSAVPDSFRLRQCQTSMVALDVHTGAILLMTGGRNFDESKFNRALQAARQVGSTFKPVVYTTAIENRFTPASMVLDQPITLMTPEGEWRPQNYDNEFLGVITLRTALEKSINLVAIQIFNDVGPNKVLGMAHRLGLTGRMLAVPSLAIGSFEIKPIEMVTAYSVFPNHGTLNKTFFIDSIIDKNGNVLERNIPHATEVISPQTAYVMCDLLASVVRRGTAAAIPQLGFSRPAGGKTGTTNEFSDAWFIGFTPQIVLCVWFGTDERRSLGVGITGAKAAVPVWVRAMKALHRNLPVAHFDRPDGIATLNICVTSRKIATRYCPKNYDEIFCTDNTPDTCTVHGLKKSGQVQRKKSGAKKGRRLMF